MSSCAYKLKSTQRQLPGGYQSLVVPVFVNRTQETGLEVSFTNALIHEFSRSKVALLQEGNRADAKVVGTVVDLLVEATNRVTSGGSGSTLPEGTVLATSYRMVINVNLKLVRQSDQRELWSHDFRSEKTYNAPEVSMAVVNTVNANYNLTARRQALDTLAQEMMNEAHNLMTESF